MVGTILLDTNNYYIDSEGKLPVRPNGDKELLKTLVSGRVVSKLAFEILPKSISSVAMGYSSTFYNVPITIKELAEAMILIVHRSPVEIEVGKKFRLDKFKQIGNGNPEIWIKQA